MYIAQSISTVCASKRGTGIADTGMRNAECGIRNPEFGVKRGVWDKTRN